MITGRPSATNSSAEPKAKNPLIYQSIDLQIWERVGNKTSGANSAGEHGGFYALKEDPDTRVFFKQDPVIEKNISEFVAAYVMRSMAEATGIDPYTIAQVELAFVPGETEPNADGTNVYIASPIYRDFLELYKDAYLAFHFLPIYEPLRTANPHLLRIPRVPKERPALLKKDDVIDLMIKAGRYHGLNPLLQLSRSVDDPDVHVGNIGAVPRDAENNEAEPPVIVEIDANGLMRAIPDDEVNNPIPEGSKRLKVFADVTAVRIDFGAAFGDARLLPRTYDHNVANRGILATLLSYHPSKAGPPPYELKIPTEVRTDPSADFWLKKIAKCKHEKVIQGFSEAMEAVAKKYGKQPLMRFAQLIGLKLNHNRKRKLTKEILKSKLTKYLSTCFISYQKSVHLDNDNNKEEAADEIPAAPNPENEKAKQRMEQQINDFSRKLSAPEIPLTLRQAAAMSLGYYATKLSEMNPNEILMQESDLKAKLNELEKNFQERFDNEIEFEKKTKPVHQRLAEIFSGFKKEEPLRKVVESLIYREFEKIKDAETRAHKIRSFDRIEAILNLIQALTAYRKVLGNSIHLNLDFSRKGLILFRTRYESVSNLLSHIANQQLDYQALISQTTTLKNTIDESTKVVQGLNELQTATRAYLPKKIRPSPTEKIMNKIHERAIKYFEHSGKAVAELLKEPVLTAEDTRVHNEVTKDVTKSISTPFEVNVERLQANSNQLNGKGSVCERLSGLGLMIAGALTVLAATFLVVGSFVLAKPSLGFSLVAGLPVSYHLYGIGTTLFSAGSMLLFSAKREGLSKATEDVAEAVAQRQKLPR